MSICARSRTAGSSSASPTCRRSRRSPQRHFTIAKHAGGGQATTTVSMLEGDGVVGELVRMLGASEQDSAASEHARELLRAA